VIDIRRMIMSKANATELVFNFGAASILFSYKTPVIVYEAGQGAVASEQFYSTTTSKHINKYAKKHGLTLRKIDHDKFLAIVSKVLTEGNGSFRLENNPF
jgi:hypothetical protein